MTQSLRSLRSICSLAFAVATLVGCGSPQKPAVFATSAKIDTGVDTVARTLASEGYSTAHVDRQAGIVHTEWKDTGFLYGQVQQRNATLVRRFTVVLAPQGEGSQVTVRMDLKRCAQGGFSIDGAEVRGPCEEAELVPEKMQEELDLLGGKVRTALSAPVAAPADGTPAPVSSNSTQL
ncbi:hypothetical protein AKJ09_10868 [Labilithrix luteola]|uniref:Lipoprotein n=1 Tax=Labilithrix luteola TaxID=1391654 RepID=A0A0K1QFL8_9BACT|nr:hypothetical protein [Labilithrix luteola]AKV04205.1 hypothetical protein AKJ09_10868 [Labilithrix luteola]